MTHGAGERKGHDLAEGSAASGHRRVRMPLSDGHMDVCLTPDASPETVEALRQIGEAALAHMKSEEEAEHGGRLVN